MGEEKVASFDGLVTGEAGLEQRLVCGFAVVKLSERPPGGLGRIFLSGGAGRRAATCSCGCTHFLKRFNII